MKDCQTEKNTKCYSCGSEGHIGKECPVSEGGKRVCYVCKSSEHLASECPQKPPPTCFICGGQGHIGRECPNPQPTISCHSCGGKGIFFGARKLITDRPQSDGVSPKSKRKGRPLQADVFELLGFVSSFNRRCGSTAAASTFFIWYRERGKRF